jgi:hypothetical protein
MIRLSKAMVSRSVRRSNNHKLPDNIDSLVYSSHKTGTQTVLATLTNSGIRARHFHIVDDVGMRANSAAFQSYLKHYRRMNRRKMTIISTFRLPWERHMSSFFQWHAQGVVRERLVSGPEDTSVARCSVDELQDIFRRQVREGSLRGREDSLSELCAQLGYQASSMTFDSARGFGVFEDELMRLLLFRFDLLFPNFNDVLEEALQTKLSPRIDNMSDDKWYGDKYKVFRTTLTASPDLIRGVHSAKKELIDVFYPLEYERIVNDHIARYGFASTDLDQARRGSFLE